MVILIMDCSNPMSEFEEEILWEHYVIDVAKVRKTLFEKNISSFQGNLGI